MDQDRLVDVKEQYKDSSNLDARVSLHARFSTSPVGWNDWLLAQLDIPATARIVEVGCGPGYLWRSTLDEVPSGWRVSCFDLSPGMVATCAANVLDDRFTFGVCDAQYVPIADNSVDAVIANHMLYHVPNIDLALAEFVRVLKPDGVVYATTNGRNHMPEVWKPAGWGMRYIEAFGLETGAEHMKRHFSDVRTVRLENSLAVTDPSAVRAYIASMSTYAKLTDERLDEIESNVASIIERDGVYTVSLDGGMLRASK